MRVVSWNLANRVGDAARRQGEFLAGLDPRPDVVMLQEVNRRSIDVVRERAELDWVCLAADIRVAEASDTPVRQRGVAVAGIGDAPVEVDVLDEVPLPERTIHAVVDLEHVPVRVASYHAPPGVSWFEKKPRQAVAFARWIASVSGPVILGADANTPLVDHPDFELTRTHWHTGHKDLNGDPGDDLLWAATKVHDLEDALRKWLRLNPDAEAALTAESPKGPLAVSHRTGKRKTSPGTARRFDSVWVTDHFTVASVAYPYELSLAAGSDHSAVIVDLSLTHAVE